MFERFYLCISREKGREGEEHQCVIASCAPPTGDLAHNPGICPDWDSNQRPFGSQARVQSTELHQPRLLILFKLIGKENFRHFHQEKNSSSLANSTLTNVVNVPKTRQPFWRKCGGHQPHKTAEH